MIPAVRVIEELHLSPFCEVTDLAWRVHSRPLKVGSFLGRSILPPSTSTRRRSDDDFRTFYAWYREADLVDLDIIGAPVFNVWVSDLCDLRYDIMAGMGLGDGDSVLFSHVHQAWVEGGKHRSSPLLHWMNGYLHWRTEEIREEVARLYMKTLDTIFVPRKPIWYTTWSYFSPKVLTREKPDFSGSLPVRVFYAESRRLYAYNWTRNEEGVTAKGESVASYGDDESNAFITRWREVVKKSESLG